MTTTNLFGHCKCKTITNLGSFRILLPFFQKSWGVGVLIQQFLNWLGCLNRNTKHFPLNLQSGSTLSKLGNFWGGFEHPTHPPTPGTPLGWWLDQVIKIHECIRKWLCLHSLSAWENLTDFYHCKNFKTYPRVSHCVHLGSPIRKKWQTYHDFKKEAPTKANLYKLEEKHSQLVLG